MGRILFLPTIFAMHGKPFAFSAQIYHDLGLSILPCSGKKPAIKSWKPFQKQLVYQNILDEWIKKYAPQNVGIITGELSNLTVVDCDYTETSLEMLFDLFGYTPLVAQTPSGGFHLYYRYNGEKSITGLNGLKIDIQSEGKYVIAPPSFNSQTGKHYIFNNNNLNCIKTLPSTKSIFDLYDSQTPKFDSETTEKKNHTQNQTILNTPPRESYFESKSHITEGKRNMTLFYMLKEEARHCRTHNQLLDKGYAINYTFFAPFLPKKEVENTVKQIWKYKITGTLIYHEGYILIKEKELQQCCMHSDALVLLTFLRYYHEGQRRTFAINQKAVSAKLKWGTDCRRIKNALMFLIENKIIRQHAKSTKSVSFQHIYKFVTS